jgi:hypothetical protein
MEAGFQCAYCGEWVETTVDAGGGSNQSYVEDCAVCCRPNVLSVSVDFETQEVFIAATFEG